ncbi:MAG: glycerophosphodiester phosphodiesterase [Clostridia bacterium]|nr:glycerophosphodiester phosphodiesterase [Clostridia bacterium]
MKPFEKHFIAHRGLFSDPGIPENSMPAFRNAVINGYGIELDLQLTKDGRLAVFHDNSLKRMCGVSKPLCRLSYAELEQLRLSGTDERIPLFTDVLGLVGGSVPLVIEIKPSKNFEKTVAKTVAALKDYKGEYCVESFDPFVLRQLKKTAPDILRGQLSRDYSDEKNKPFIERFVKTNLLFNFIGKPDFIAYRFDQSDRFSYRICRKLFKPVNAAWTIRNRRELDEAEKNFQIFIFEGFRPEQPSPKKDLS